ncbi:hypothetical protein [Aquimarina brevivitae]|uniref:Uncharacterized protein n=1 Tax=Aquimarina brevivitae TaxID=323412 RepID=A0A4Q7P1D1_9FLAO|nr:hypothetical protein [Aquimarina brevivitae]RZS93631.1 hypothetical protein EV197_2211 [Aquimarina brevivitae]
MRALKVVATVIGILALGFCVIVFPFPMLIESIVDYDRGGTDTTLKIIFSLFQILIGYYFIHKGVSFIFKR